MGLPPHFLLDAKLNKKLALNTKLPFGMLKTGGGITGEIDPRETLNLIPNALSFSPDVSDWYVGGVNPKITLTSSGGLVDELGDTINLLTNQQIFKDGDYIYYESTTGSVIGGLAVTTAYYVVNSTATTIQLSSTLGGTPINLTSDGTGDHVFRRVTRKLEYIDRSSTFTSKLRVNHNAQATSTQTYVTGSSTSVLLQVGDPLTYQAAMVLTPTQNIYTNKIKLKLHAGGTPWTSGTFVIEIRSVSAGNPTLVVLAQTGALDVTNNNHLPYGSQPLVEYQLSSYVSFESGVPIAIVVRPLSTLSGSSSTIRITSDTGGGDANAVAKTSTTGGLSWSNQTYDWQYEITGDNISSGNDVLSTVGQMNLQKDAGVLDACALIVQSKRIPIAWRGKPVLLGFDFKCPSGSAYTVHLFDGDTAQPLTIKGLSAAETVLTGNPVGYPIAANTTSSHKLLVNCNSGTKSIILMFVIEDGSVASDAYISNFSLDVQSYVAGFAATNDKNFTPNFTMSGSPITYGAGNSSAVMARFGRFLYVRGYFELGAGFSVPGGSLLFSLPDSLIIDAQGKTLVSSGSQFGRFNIHDAGANRFSGDVTYSSPAGVVFSLGDDYAGSATNPIGANLFVTNTTPMTWASGDQFEFWAMIPIKDWNMTTQLSTAELMLKNAGARVEKSGTQAFSVETKVTSWTMIKDTGAMWDSTNNRMVATNPGWHIIMLQAYFTPTTTAQAMCAYRVNGGGSNYVGEWPGATTASDRNGGWGLVYLNRNDYVEFYIPTNAAITVQAGNGTVFGMVNIADLTMMGVNTVGADVLGATSSIKTPTASARFHDHTGNSLTLTPGIWELMPSMVAAYSSGGSAAFSNVQGGWHGADGADSGVAPVALTTLSGLTVLSNSQADWHGKSLFISGASFDNAQFTTSSVIIKCTKTTTVYLTTYSDQTTSANARIVVHPNARRLA